MNLHPEDPRLTAWLLGELSAEEAAEVQRAVAADPALQIAVREMEKTQQLLVETLSASPASLLPRQRDLVLQAAREADRGQSPRPVTVKPPRKSIPWLFPLATAAVLTLAALMLVRLPGTDPKAANPDRQRPATEDKLPLEIALLPAPAPADPGSRSQDPRPTASGSLSAAAAARSRALDDQGDLFLRKVAERLAEAPVPPEQDLPPLGRRSAVNAIDHPQLQLPVHSGRASLGWITRSIRGDKKRPPANAVRLEEILNHFSLRPAGPASVAQGVTLSTESITCPWKPSATLLVVSLRGAADTARNVTATFKANPASIRSYRLLGFAPVTGLPASPELPSRLPAKSVTSLVIEIDPAAPTGSLGTIDWTVSGQAGPTISLSRRSDAEPSDDARFAALVCTYAQWLSGDASSPIDTDLLAALARECDSATLAADRADFLALVDQSLGL